MAFLFGALLAIEMLEEEERRKHSRITRRMLRDTDNPFSASDREFIDSFRLNKEACLYVIKKVSPALNNGRYANRVPVHLRVLCALHFLAVGSYQRSVGNNSWACLSQSTVSLSVGEFVVAIIQRGMNEWIQFPRNDAQKKVLKSRFSQVHRLHNIIGIVDGTQVAIVKPRMPVEATPFLNSKEYYSINVQIISDADGCILSIVARWPGSTDDSFIWENSFVSRTMRANYESGDENTAIMGDSGYPCLPWLYVPVTRPATQQEQAYNNAFVSAKSTVERTVGILKGRFRCLLSEKPLHYKPVKACRIIMACAILHNIARKYRVEDPEPQFDEIDLDPPVAPLPEPDDVYRQKGQEVRHNYIRSYY